jgi:hypothetical protein
LEREKSILESVVMGSIFENIFRGRSILFTDDKGLEGSWPATWHLNLRANIFNHSLPRKTAIDDLALCRLNDTIRHGGDTVQAFYEKLQTPLDLMNGGFLVFNRKVFNYLANDESHYEKLAFRNSWRLRRALVYKHAGSWAWGAIRVVNLLTHFMRGIKPFARRGVDHECACNRQ